MGGLKDVEQKQQNGGPMCDFKSCETTERCKTCLASHDWRSCFCGTPAGIHCLSLNWSWQCTLSSHPHFLVGRQESKVSRALTPKAGHVSTSQGREPLGSRCDPQRWPKSQPRPQSETRTQHCAVLTLHHFKNHFNMGIWRHQSGVRSEEFYKYVTIGQQKTSNP